jgi:hypothetical protein
MKKFTPKQLEKLESQIDAISSKLTKVCTQHKIGDKKLELPCGWDDWDNYESQEAIVNALQNIDIELSNLSYYIYQMTKK